MGVGVKSTLMKYAGENKLELEVNIRERKGIIQMGLSEIKDSGRKLQNEIQTGKIQTNMFEENSVKYRYSNSLKGLGEV